MITMLNITKSYATVWQPENKGKYISARLSTGHKNQDGTWTNSSWYARFVGRCKQNAALLKERDRIVITNAIIENVYDKEQKKSWLTLVIFDFDAEQKTSNNFVPMPQYDEDELPF